MKIGIVINTLMQRFGLEEACKLIKEAGFNYVDFQLTKPKVSDALFFKEDIDTFINYFKEAKTVINSYGLIVNQTHFPFGFDEEEVLFTEGFENVLKRSIIATSTLGAKYVVVHPVKMQCRNQDNLENAFNKNYEQMIRFNDLLEEYNVKMALENLFIPEEKDNRRYVPTVLSNPKDMNRMLSKLGKNYVTVFDTGHAHISNVAPIDDTIIELGKNLEVLHIHDNNKVFDDHLIPYEGSINWEGFIKGMKEIKFDGVYSYEIVLYEPKEIILKRLKYVVENAKYLISRINEN